MNQEKPDNIVVDEVMGIVVETPIIRWFRRLQLKKPEYFNQATMLTLDEDVSADMVKMALLELSKHHDILRAVYVQDELRILSCDQSKMYELHECSIEDTKDIQKEIHDKCTEIQASIDLEQGPLMKACLFHTKYGNHLMICIHHLAIDIISWGILSEDFKMAINCCKQGKEIMLPAKTASFIEWANALEEYKATDKLKAEKEYWDTYEDQKDKLKLQIPEQSNDRNVNGYKECELSKEDTECLLRKVSKAYDTRINDLLLAGISMALGKLVDQEYVAVGMEGHGREEIHRPISIERTIGWFTSIYPAILSCKKDLKETITYTKDMFGNMPNHGMGYGLLYDTNLKDYLSIFFNYIGELGKDDKKEVALSSGESAAIENRLPGIFTINVCVMEDKMNFSIAYQGCTDQFADQFAVGIGSCMKEIIQHCKEIVDQKDDCEEKQTEDQMYDEYQNALLQEMKLVCRVDQAELSDNFFDIGGDSMKATLIVRHLQKSGYTLSVKDIMSIGELGEIADRMKINAEEQNL